MVNKPVSELFNLIESPESMQSIMPDNVNKFETTQNGFVFGIQGAPIDIGLAIKETITNEKIVLESTNPNLNFTLTTLLAELNTQESQVQILFNGSFNPMVKMMIQKPLQRFIDDLANNLEKL